LHHFERAHHLLRGANVVLMAAKVQKGGGLKGSDEVAPEVESIAAAQIAYPVVTTMSQSKTEFGGKKIARRTIVASGLGAAIGGIAGGGEDAAIGAAGGAASEVVPSAGKTHLMVPAKTRLEFRPMADWKIQPLRAKAGSE
jgi:hypothetical protein